jgi:hypothetical protein
MTWYIVLISLATGLVVQQVPLHKTRPDVVAALVCGKMLSFAVREHNKTHAGRANPVRAECRHL